MENINHQRFQAGIEQGPRGVTSPILVLVVVHALWPELQFAAEDIEPVDGQGTWLIPVPADLVSDLLVVGLSRHIEVQGLGAFDVDIPTT